VIKIATKPLSCPFAILAVFNRNEVANRLNAGREKGNHTRCLDPETFHRPNYTSTKDCFAYFDFSQEGQSDNDAMASFSSATAEDSKGDRSVEPLANSS
jgi:hypothetical protein